MTVRFLIYGILGWSVEILWTAIARVLQNGSDLRLMGHTYLWMFFIYGAAALGFEQVYRAISDWSWYWRGLTWVLLIFLVEYSAGYLLLSTTGSCPWDYSHHSSLHINGLIRLDYAPAWFALGLVFERVHQIVLRITPLVISSLKEL